MDIIILFLIFMISAFLICLAFWKENAVLLFIGGLTLILLGFVLYDGIRYTDGTIGMSESWEDTNTMYLWTGQTYGDDCEATTGLYGMMAPDRLLLHLDGLLGSSDFCTIEDSSCANNHARRDVEGTEDYNLGVLTEQDGFFGSSMYFNWEEAYSQNNGTIIVNGSCSADSTPANFTCDDAGTMAMWWGFNYNDFIAGGFCGEDTSDITGIKRIATLSKREGNSTENKTEIMILGVWCYDDNGKDFFRLCSGIYGGGNPENNYWQSLWCSSDFGVDTAREILPDNMVSQRHYIIRTVGTDEMKVYVDGSPIEFSPMIEGIPGAFWFSDLSEEGESCDDSNYVFQLSGSMSNIATMSYQGIHSAVPYMSLDEVALWSVEFTDANASNAYTHMYSVTEDRVSVWSNSTASYLYVEEQNIWINGLGLTIVLLGLLITINASLELATQGRHKFL
jgi:hypothetical protein